MTDAPLVFEAATPEDLAALVALERVCHSHPWSEVGLRDAIVPTVGQGSILLLRAPWGPPDEGRGIRAYCAIQRVADEAHVHNLAVAPEARRRGLARGLLTLALGAAARQGARVAHLEVRASNSAARSLYGAMGFREVGRRRDYYSAPVEDAVLLSRDDLAAEP